MISTKGRYALRMLIDLAEHNNGGYIPMKSVAERQDLPLKYLERLIPPLKEHGLLEGVHGKGGGYRLAGAPEDYTVWDILNIMEGSLAPVSCIEKGGKACGRAPSCKTLGMWKDYYDMTKEFFSGITIADLMKRDPNFEDYVI